MLTTALKQQIDIVIETALLLARKGTPLKELAQRTYAAERNVFDQAQESWMLDRIVWMLSRQRQKIHSVDGVGEALGDQFLLPGFERLPKRLTLRNGRWTALGNARLPQVREYREALLNQLTNYRKTLAAKDPAGDPRIVALDKLIELMKKYLTRGKTITVGSVMALERAQQERPAKS